VAMLHKPLKPRTMLTAEPAIKAPWVALIAWTNLYKKHADSVRTCVIADKRRETKMQSTGEGTTVVVTTSCGSPMSMMRGELTMDRITGRK